MLLAVVMTRPLTIRLGSAIGRDLGEPLFQAWLRSAGIRTVLVHLDLTPGTPWEHTPSRPIGGLPLTHEIADGVILYRVTGA